MKSLIKLEIIFLTFSFCQFQSNFFQENLEYLTKSLTNKLIISKNSQDIIFYKYTANYENQDRVWVYQGSKNSISNSFDLQVALFNTETASMSFTFLSNSLTIFTFQINIDSSGTTTLVLSGCQITQILSSTTQTFACKNDQSEAISITADANLTPIASNSSIVISQNTETTDPLYLIDIGISFIYTIGTTQNAANYSLINQWFIKMTSINANYISILNYQFSQINCPDGCTTCSSSGTCNSCFTNFTLSSGSCVCPYEEMQNFILNEDISLYYQYSVCKDTTIKSIKDEADDFISCQNSLKNMLAENYIDIVSGATFDEKQITFTYDYVSGTSIKLLRSFCTDYLKVYPTLQIRAPQESTEIFFKLNDSPQFSQTKSYTLTFTSWNSCVTTLYSSLSFQSTVCSIKTFWILNSSNFTNIVSQIIAEYVQLTNITTNQSISKSVLPIYTNNSNINLIITSGISVKLCLDSNCYNPIDSYDFIQTNMLYAMIVIKDPLYLQSSPTVTYTFFVNNEVRTSLIQDYSKIGQISVPKYLMSILLDSSDIGGETQMKIILTYTANSATQTQSIQFKMNIVDPYKSAGSKDFTDRISFVFLVFTFGGFGTLALFGIFTSLIAQYFGKRDNMDEIPKEMNERSFELKNLSQSNQTNSNVSKNPKVNKLLESLMQQLIVILSSKLKLFLFQKILNSYYKCFPPNSLIRKKKRISIVINKRLIQKFLDSLGNLLRNYFHSKEVIFLKKIRVIQNLNKQKISIKIERSVQVKRILKEDQETPQILKIMNPKFNKNMKVLSQVKIYYQKKQKIKVKNQLLQNIRF